MSALSKKISKAWRNSNSPIKWVWERFQEKGHQRLTILIIPHGYANSFSFQISLFSIVFLFSLLGSLVWISVFGFMRSKNTESEIDKLSHVYGSYFEEYMQLVNQLDQIKEDYLSMTENLIAVYGMLDGSDDELTKLPSYSKFRIQAKQELNQEALQDSQLYQGKGYLPEIEEYRAIRLDMLSNLRVADANLSMIELRSKIYANIPLRQPIRNSYNLTSNFGLRKSPTTGGWEFHDGVDMAQAVGTPIYATASGFANRVLFSKSGYGHHIILEHGYGFYTLYGHCSKIFIKQGDWVEEGTLIATVGATGNVTGPHLHYEVWSSDSSKLDPEEFLHTGAF